MEDSDRPEQDELNKRMMGIKDLKFETLKEKNIQKSIRSAEWEEFLEEFALGCDPSWHEHKGTVKQEDD